MSYQGNEADSAGNLCQAVSNHFNSVLAVLMILGECTLTFQLVDWDMT